MSAVLWRRFLQFFADVARKNRPDQEDGQQERYGIKQALDIKAGQAAIAQV
jgi:hypothetical protein